MFLKGFVRRIQETDWSVGKVQFRFWKHSLFWQLGTLLVHVLWIVALRSRAGRGGCFAYFEVSCRHPVSLTDRVEDWLKVTDILPRCLRTSAFLVKILCSVLVNKFTFTSWLTARQSFSFRWGILVLFVTSSVVLHVACMLLVARMWELDASCHRVYFYGRVRLCGSHGDAICPVPKCG